VKPKDLDEDVDGETKQSIDTITVQGIVGFTVQCGAVPALSGRLFVRQGVEFYERPVYVNEAKLLEDSTLYLYWFKDGGDLNEGLSMGNERNIRDAVDASEIFQSGCWVVSAKMGASPTSSGGDHVDTEYLVAYLNDRAFSPYYIATGAKWWVKDDTLGSWISTQLDCMHQVSQKPDQAMDFFDSSDEEDLSDSD